MASLQMVIDFTKWPEVLHGIRHEVVNLLMAEAEEAEPAVAEALQRVAVKLDMGLTEAAKLEEQG